VPWRTTGAIALNFIVRADIADVITYAIFYVNRLFRSSDTPNFAILHRLSWSPLQQCKHYRTTLWYDLSSFSGFQQQIVGLSMWVHTEPKFGFILILSYSKRNLTDLTSLTLTLGLSSWVVGIRKWNTGSIMLTRVRLDWQPLCELQRLKCLIRRHKSLAKWEHRTEQPVCSGEWRWMHCKPSRTQRRYQHLRPQLQSSDGNFELHSIRWFFHRHSPSPPDGHAMVSPVTACCVRPAAHALLCIVNGDDSVVFRFLSLVPNTVSVSAQVTMTELLTKFNGGKRPQRSIKVIANFLF